MSKKITLNKVPLSDCPAIAHDLIAGKVEVHVVIQPMEGWEFHYIEGGRERAKSGRYKVADLVGLSSSLLHPRQDQGELLVIPGVLIDDQGKCFRLYHDEEHFNADGGFEHWIDQYGNNIPVDLPARLVQLEWLEPVEKTTEPRGIAGQLVKEYLESNPTGNLAGLRKWAAEEYRAARTMVDNKWYLHWMDWQGKKQNTPEKTLSNLLSEYRK